MSTRPSDGGEGGAAPAPARSSRSPRTSLLANPTLRALLAICLFTYVAQNMLNVSIAPLARAVGLREWIVGVAVSSAALFVTLLSQFWGRRSIAWGRRRVLLASLTLAVIAGSLFSGAVALRAAGTLGATAAALGIVVARGPFFGSAVSAIPPTGQALVAEITPAEEDRVRGMAAFSGSIQLSIVIGSVVSSALGAWSIYAPVHATPVFVVIALIIGVVGIPRDGAEPRRRRRRMRRALRRPVTADPVTTTRDAPSAAALAAPADPGATVLPERATLESALSEADPSGAGTVTAGAPVSPAARPAARALPPRVSWTDPRLLPWIGAAFGMFFTSGVVQIIAGFIVQDRLGLSPQRAVSVTAVMLLANAAGAMLTQLVAVPRLGWRPQRLVRTGVTLALVALVVLALAPSLPLMAGATFCVGLAAGLTGPGFTAGGSLAVSGPEQGGVAGILNATGSLTWVFAPVTATALYGWHPIAPFVLAGAVLAVSVTTAWTAGSLRP